MGEVHRLGLGAVNQSLLHADIHRPDPVAGGNWTQVTILFANFVPLTHSPKRLWLLTMCLLLGLWCNVMRGAWTLRWIMTLTTCVLPNHLILVTNIVSCSNP